jgi:hypothetical protein
VAFTVIVKVWLATDRVLSATRTVNVVVPTAPGVPAKTPAEDSVSPAGSDPATAQV